MPMHPDHGKATTSPAVTRRGFFICYCV